MSKRVVDHLAATLGPVVVILVATAAVAHTQSLLRKDEPTHVKTLGELRPVLPVEKRRAELLDQPGSMALERLVGGESFTVVQAHKGGDSTIWDLSDVLGTPTPPTPTLSAEERARIQVCRAERVIQAHAVSLKVYLNKSETGFVTDFTFEVEKWIRPVANSSSPRHVVVSTRGGVVMVGSQMIALGEERTSIGEPYILFLRALPGTDSFGAIEQPLRFSSASPGRDGSDDSLKTLNLAAQSCTGG